MIKFIEIDGFLIFISNQINYKQKNIIHFCTNRFRLRKNELITYLKLETWEISLLRNFFKKVQL